MSDRSRRRRRRRWEPCGSVWVRFGSVVDLMARDVVGLCAVAEGFVRGQVDGDGSTKLDADGSYTELMRWGRSRYCGHDWNGEIVGCEFRVR